MRALLLVCFVAAANAAFAPINIQKHAQPVVRAAVQDFVAHLQSGPGLAEFLNLPQNALIDNIEKQTQTELGQALSQQLQAVLEQIQSGIDHGQMVAQSLIDKAKELLQNLSAIGVNVAQLANQFLSELAQMGMMSLTNLLGKRSVTNQLQGMLENISGEVQALLASIVGQLQVLVNGITGKRSVDSRVWNLITDTIQQIIQSLGANLSQFGQWVNQIMSGSTTVIQGHLTNIQQMAQQVLAHVNELTASTVQQALEFFKPYQNDLGVLWQQLVTAAQQITSQIQG